MGAHLQHLWWGKARCWSGVVSSNIPVFTAHFTILDICLDIVYYAVFFTPVHDCLAILYCMHSDSPLSETLNLALPYNFQWLSSHLVPVLFECRIDTMHNEEVYLLPTWAQKIVCGRSDWILQSSSGQTWTNTDIYSHELLRIHDIGDQKGRITPPSLPYHSGPATWGFLSPILVEAFLWGCHLDV